MSRIELFMKITVLIHWPNGRSSQNTWDYNNRDDRRTMAMEIADALAGGAVVVSSKNTYEVVEFLGQCLRDNSDLV